jgi:dynein heavy chain
MLNFVFLRIISSLSPEERGLFKERIRNLDKRMQHGFTKLTWAKVQAAYEYISNCRRHSSDLQTVVDELQTFIIECHFKK